MRKKVYISSTLDLPEYRKAIEDTFRKLSKSFEVVRIAEYMTASTNTPLEECLKDVSSCNMYVLIIGHRYGSIAPGTAFSFTHCEYNKALEECDQQREILVFYAAESMTGLRTETENPDKFAVFKKAVLSRHLADLKGFKDEEELTIQLLEALTLRVYENLPVIRNETIEYKCDRVDSVTSYMDGLSQLKGKPVFPTIFYGTLNDRPKNFTDRLVKIECESTVKASLTRTLYNNSTSQEKASFNILRNIYVQLFPEDKKYYRNAAVLQTFSQPALFFSLLQEKGIEELFIEFVIELEELKDALMTGTLKDFVGELNNAVPAQLLVHNSFLICGNQSFDAIEKDYSAFKESFPGITDISYLRKVTRQDIYNWIEKELQLNLPPKIDCLINKYFSSGKFEISMCDAQEKLQTMVNELDYNIES